MRSAYIETLYEVIGGNLSEERLSPVPPSKDFYLIFSLIGRDLYTCRSFLLLSRPIKEKIKTEVLGKEFEEEPFFKRVFLNSSRKNFYISITLNACAFCIFRSFLHIIFS